MLLYELRQDDDAGAAGERRLLRADGGRAGPRSEGPQHQPTGRDQDARPAVSGPETECDDYADGKTAERLAPLSSISNGF